MRFATMFLVPSLVTLLLGLVMFVWAEHSRSIAISISVLWVNIFLIYVRLGYVLTGLLTGEFGYLMEMKMVWEDDFTVTDIGRLE